MHDLTSFQRDLLFVIARLGDPYGLEIKERIQEYYAGDVNHGRLYPNLDTLVDKGLIEKGKKDERTNSYRLTDSGRRAIADRLEWEQRQVGASETVSV